AGSPSANRPSRTCSVRHSCVTRSQDLPTNLSPIRLDPERSDCQASGLQLAADLTALMLTAVDVGLQIARLDRPILRLRQLGSGWDGPGAIAVFCERHDDGTILTGRATVNVSHRAAHAARLHAAADALVLADRDRPGSRAR